MKTRKWYGLVILAGVLFSLYYVRNASYDVVYSDYIRLVNNYLPDVWNPDKFFVPDILTRIPVTAMVSMHRASCAFPSVLAVCTRRLYSFRVNSFSSCKNRFFCVFTRRILSSQYPQNIKN